MKGCQWITGDVRVGTYSYCGKNTCSRGSGAWCTEHAGQVYEGTRPKPVNGFGLGDGRGGGGIELRGGGGLGFAHGGRGKTLGPSGARGEFRVGRFRGRSREALDPALARDDVERRFVQEWNSGGSKTYMMGVLGVKSSASLYKKVRKMRNRRV